MGDAGYRELTVRSGEQGKGRSFRAAVLAVATAPIWGKHLPETTAVRPVFLVLGCQAGEAGPVTANLRLGHRATVTGEGITQKGVTLECLKSERYAWSAQRTAAGVAVTARLPGLCALDPGLYEPDQPVRFLVAPPRARLEEELARLPAADMRAYGEGLVDDAFAQSTYSWVKPDLQRDSDEWRLMPAMALWVCAMIDRRVPVPVLPDPLFQVRLYLGALKAGLAGWRKTDNGYGNDRSTWGRRGPALREWGYGRVGFAPGVAFASSQDGVRDLLVQEVRAWQAERHVRNAAAVVQG